MKPNCMEWLSGPRIVCGLMTGTSLDGIDVALARFCVEPDGRHGMEIIDFDTYEYPEEIRGIVIDIIEGRAGVRDISFVHGALPQIYAESIDKLCRKTKLEMSCIDAVGIHGQTVWHEPKPRQEVNIRAASTLQMGSVSALASIMGLTAVGDFRAADIALGGQGAPLVPIFDYEFLSSPDENVIALNIGGMSNITVMPAGCRDDDVRAFDTGPGNVWIDMAMKDYFCQNYDINGQTAHKGSVINPLLEALKQIEFIRQSPPKSTGRELFNLDTLRGFIYKHVTLCEPVENIIRTLTGFTAWSIVENIRLFALPHLVKAIAPLSAFGKGEFREGLNVVVSGGGSRNGTLLELLREELPEARIIISDDAGIPSDAKEAICFAYLAYRSLGGLHGNMPSVTGAIRKSVLGVVSC